jgi:hypothetical protein
MAFLLLLRAPERLSDFAIELRRVTEIGPVVVRIHRKLCARPGAPAPLADHGKGEQGQQRRGSRVP